MANTRNTGSRVRSAGSPNDIDDLTLRETNSPDVLSSLTPDQLKRRRDLRKQQAALAREGRRREAAKKSKGHKPLTIYCVGHTDIGEPCRSKHVVGSDYCVWHMEKAELARLDLRDPREVTRAAPSLKAPEMMKRVMENNVNLILRPYFEALGIQLIGYDEETGLPVVEKTEGGGLTLYGESKDGDIVMTPYPDLAGMVAVAEKLMDRVYGKPKQSTTIEGGINPIRVQPVKSEERAVEVAQILAAARVLPPAAGAVSQPHEGRRRPQSAEVIDINRDGDKS